MKESSKKNNRESIMSPVQKSNDNDLSIEEWASKAKSIKTKPHLIKELLADSPGAYGIIAGRTGIGKTNIALDLGFCLATGSKWFDFECKKVKVKMIAFEGDRQSLSSRINKIKKNFPPTDGRFRFDLISVNSVIEMQDQLIQSLKSSEGIKVAIIDPIKYIVEGDYLKTSDANDFTNRLQRLLIELRISAIFTFAIRKPVSFKGLVNFGDVYSVKRATEWVDAATFVTLVEKRARKENQTFLSFPKTRVSTIGEIRSVLVTFNPMKCMFEKSFRHNEEIIEADLDAI